MKKHNQFSGNSKINQSLIERLHNSIDAIKHQSEIGSLDIYKLVQHYYLQEQFVAFKKRQAKYRILFEKYKAADALCFYPAASAAPPHYLYLGPDCVVPFNNSNEYGIQKKSILERLISLLAPGIINQETISELWNLENRLLEFLDFGDRLVLSDYALLTCPDAVLLSIKEFIQEHGEKILRKWLAFAYSFFFIRTIRDLRSSFRSIIKFLFKNLDDEHSADNVVNKKNKSTLSTFVNFFILWNPRKLWLNSNRSLNPTQIYQVKNNMPYSLPVISLPIRKMQKIG